MAAKTPGDDSLLFCVHVAGRSLVRQHDRFAELTAGFDVLYEARSAWELLSSTESRSLTLHHGDGTANHCNVLSQDFADAFGIAGTPDQCIERVKELQGLGLDRIKVVPALSQEAADLEDVALSWTTMQKEVIPALRG
jgi:hypothetical protein